MTARLNHWLRVRHAVAHGHVVLPAVPVLGIHHGLPVLHLSHAERCMMFFRRIVGHTQAGMEGAFAGL